MLNEWVMIWDKVGSSYVWEGSSLCRARTDRRWVDLDLAQYAILRGESSQDCLRWHPDSI